MKLSTPFLLILAAAGFVEASHDGLNRIARHNHIAARKDNTVIRRTTSGRCKVRATTSLEATSTSSTSTHHTTSTSSTKKAAPTALNTSTKSSSDSDKSTSSNSASTSGLIRITSSSCGSPGAVKSISATKGPNGNIDWFNCGVDNSGWQPPKVSVSDIVTVDLDTAVQDPNSPFKACTAYIDLFKQYGNEYGIPPILVASIAMQESSCNPQTVGGAGEQGLMQLTKDKCGSAPGGNCKEVNYNIKTGVAYFSSVLKSYDNSLLETIGSYNGWYKGMTVGAATAIEPTCCRCQQNLDYLQQVLNGWVLNYNPYSNRLGKYFNLDPCPED